MLMAIGFLLKKRTVLLTQSIVNFPNWLPRPADAAEQQKRIAVGASISEVAFVGGQSVLMTAGEEAGNH